MREEIWLPVVGYENSHEVSNNGIIRNKKGKIISYLLSDKGYIRVSIWDGKKQKNHMAHRIVALAFISKIDGKEYVNHINGIKQDNRVENLEWVNTSENMLHKFRVLKYRNANRKLDKDKFFRLLSLREFEITKYCKEIGITRCRAIKIIRGAGYDEYRKEFLSTNKAK